MAARMIRDGLLDSERVQKRSVPARWLFVTIMLSADDIGLFEVSHFQLHRKAALNEKIIPKLLKELAEADLYRPYEVSGKRYGFVPRYGQRLQVTRSKYPVPPSDVLRDDDDALSKINKLASNPPLANGGPPLNTVGHGDPPPELELEEELEVGTKKKRLTSSAKPTTTLPTCPYQLIVESYHAHLPTLPKVQLTEGTKTWEKRKKAMVAFWTFVLTSKRSDDERRAENPVQAMAWIDKYFERASANGFVMGRTKKTPGHEHWKADFDYLVGESGWVQVIEKTDS